MALLFMVANAGAVSVNGGRARANNFSVNGGDANDQFVNLADGATRPDSIEEFRVITNTFDAEYGRNSGSVVNVVTKSGTNNLHGESYEYFRNTVLDAQQLLPDGGGRSSWREAAVESEPIWRARLADRSRRTAHFSLLRMKGGAYVKVFSRRL